MSKLQHPARRAPSAPPRSHASVSPWPVIFGCAATAASLIIAVLVAVFLSAPSTGLGIEIPIVRSEYAWLSLLGWLLTPVAVIACYGWDVIGQRNGLRRNRDIVLQPAWTTVLLTLSGVGILIGVWHILNLSVPLSEWMGFA
nr:hypothetical protein GCM10025699_02280 [Microbacterium flavescens]